MPRLTCTLQEYLAQPVPSLTYLVDGLIPTRSFTVLWGPPKSGKTILSLQLGLAIASGSPFLGQRSCKAPVLVIELDTSDLMFRTTLRGLGSILVQTDSLYLPQPEGLIDHYPMNLLNESSQQYLHALVMEVQPSLVIVDCLSELGNHNENEMKDMKPIISALKHVTTFHPLYPCAVLLIHHTVKFDYSNTQVPIPSPLKAGRGSGYLAGAADSIWFLHRLTSDQDPRGLLKVVPRFGSPSTHTLTQGQGGLWTPT